MLLYFALIAVFFVAHIGFMTTHFSQRTGNTWPWEIWILISLLMFSAGAGWLSVVYPVTIGYGAGYLTLIFVLGLLVGKPWRKHSFVLPSVGEFSVLVAIALVFSVGGAAQISYNDTLIYHTQAIKWIQEYPVVPGLGNLHTRFAFNSHVFTAAAGSSFAYNGALIYPFNTCLLITSLALILRYAKRASFAQNAIPPVVYALLVLIVILLYPSWAHTPSSDIAIAALTIVAFVVAWNAMVTPRIADVILLSALIATAISYKLSTLFLVLLPVYIAWRVMRLNGALSVRRSVGWSLLVFVVVLSPFAVRNVILSGYLVYPLPGVDLFDFDWKIPLATAQFDSDYITAWARIPWVPVYEVLAMPFTEWFPVWLGKKSIPFIILLLGTAMSLFALVWSVVKRNTSVQLTLIVVWVNVVFWWVTAPDPRFIHGILFVATTITAGVVLQTMSVAQLPWRLTQIAIAVALVLAPFTIKDDLRLLVTNHLLYPRAYPQGEQTWVRTELATYRIPSVDNQCYDAPLPCAEKPIDQLEMRGKTLAEGYRIKSNESP